MADRVDTLVLRNQPGEYAVGWMNKSDGTGEAAVIKLDISTLAGPLGDGVAPTSVSVAEISWCIQGFTSVELLWDHNTDDEIDILSGAGYRNYRDLSYLVDPKSAGGTGDVLLTTTGAVAGATYDIAICFRLNT